MSKAYQYVKTWRTRVKGMAVLYKGSECQICGYSKCTAAMDFHHIDPDEKDFAISEAIKNPKSLEVILSELDKCVLLCSNCHREFHAGVVDLPDVSKLPMDAEENYRRLKQSDYFPDRVVRTCECGKQIGSESKTCLQCKVDLGLGCKIAWPPVEEVLIRLRQGSFSALGRELGVSDNAVRKFLKRKGVDPSKIETPRRRVRDGEGG